MLLGGHYYVTGGTDHMIRVYNMYPTPIPEPWELPGHTVRIYHVMICPLSVFDFYIQSGFICYLNVILYSSAKVNLTYYVLTGSYHDSQVWTHLFIVS